MLDFLLNAAWGGLLCSGLTMTGVSSWLYRANASDAVAMKDTYSRRHVTDLSIHAHYRVLSDRRDRARRLGSIAPWVSLSSLIPSLLNIWL